MPSEESYWEKYSGGSKEEMELKRMADEQYEEDDYYGGKMERYEDDDYDDDIEYEYEDEAYEKESPDPGNFWSNPSGRMDRPIPMSNRRPVRRSPNSNSEEMRRRPPKKRSTFGIGQRPPPKPAKDFYERLFWYGFDPDDSEEVGDKTMFGGTKGKFNGLSYAEASEKRPNGGSYRRKLPPPRQAYENYYDNVEIDDNDNDQYEDYNESSDPRLGSIKPPNDFPYPRSDPRSGPRRKGMVPAKSRSGSRRPQSSTRRTEYYDDNEYDKDDDDDWISKSVSSWFSGNEVDSSYDNNRSRRRQGRNKSSQWSPFTIVDAFFGVDRDDMKSKANLYNEKMGLGESRSVSSRRRQRQSSSRDIPRRPGYAYRYSEDDNDNDLNPVLDIATPAASVDKIAATDVDLASTAGTKQYDPSEAVMQKREKTWEERSLAVERVPPADIPAWGPSGELPYDARAKAIVDALEDIQTAKLKLEKKEKKETLAREEITILKVDAELQRRKLENSREDARYAQEQLRQIDFELDDASRDLRRARAQVGLARDELERLQERHWALLGFYNPDQAEEEVEAALRELEEVEPAAKLNGSGDEAPEKVEIAPETDSKSPAEKESID